MLLEITDISVSRGGQTVLSGCSFVIHGTEKIALTGANGAGKTTFLEVLAGVREAQINEKNPASGIRMARHLTIGLLSQFSEEPGLTAEECLQKSMIRYPAEEKERYTAEAEGDRMFTALGFSLKDKKKTLGSFSGGEQRKIALICLMLSRPDILLLDEPSNHLDLEASEWLEQYLKRYPKAVVVVSHDRYFLDQVADAVVEIEDGKLTRYAGNYTRFKEEKKAVRQRQRKAYEQQQEEIRRLNELIERFRGKPNKAAFARSRKKILERMERIEKPKDDPPSLRGELGTPARRSSKWVWECEDLLVGYDRPLQRLDLRLRRGQKLGILGPNGSGKSTFLKTLAGEIPPLSGKQHWGNGADMAYFGQQAAQISSEKPLLAWFRERYPSMTEQDARRTLASWLFTWQDMATPVSSLSGGEKARLQLAVLFLSRPNLLILDEPTNHMDIPSREAVEQILAGYEGTLVVVSHDRYFLERTAQSLLIFRKEGMPPQYYPFGYRHYRERTGRNWGNDAPGREMAEQAMIAGLRAVPRGNSLTGGHISDDAVYRDWRLREPEEALAAAETSMEEWETLTRTEEWFTDSAVQEKAREQEKAARETWTRACLDWYDAWLDCQPQ